MDAILGSVTSQAMNYAIRTGVTLTATYAIQQSNKLLRAAPKSSIRDEIMVLQQRLQHKISIISPAIDMIELISARGNTSLGTAMALTKDLRLEIQILGKRLAAAAEANQASLNTRHNKQSQAQNELEMKQIARDIQNLIERIEDAVPLINLAITTSGVTLSTKLPSTVSPSRLLQASTLLTAGDSQYQANPTSAVQVGPTFTLTIYMLFAGYNRPQNDEDIRETTWKEVIHKARVKMRRVPLDIVTGTGSGSEALQSKDIKSASSGPNRQESDIPADTRSEEYAYQLMIVEDFDDDRVHDFEDNQAKPGPFDDVKLAGIREMVPIHEISKIFYADTSKVLNIGTDSEANHPVLLLKRDVNAAPPRRMAERENPDEDINEQEYVKRDHEDRDDDPWRLPPSLDPEWIAFEVYTEPADSDSDTEAADLASDDTSRVEPSPSLDDSISRLNLNDTPVSTSSTSKPLPTYLPTQHPQWTNHIPDKLQTNLSLLELLLRLTSLQQFQQQSHLSITDELLNFFLEESASTGAGGDENYRQAVRADARRRVGWDPYDESPIKRRGEDYQYQNQGQYYDSPNNRSQQGYASPSYLNGGGGGGGGRGVGWSPQNNNASIQSPPSQGQTRSMTQITDAAISPSPSPSPLQAKSREQWMRNQQEEQEKTERRGSPLRPSTGRSDEGLGTSPVGEE